MQFSFAVQGQYQELFGGTHTPPQHVDHSEEEDQQHQLMYHQREKPMMMLLLQLPLELTLW